MAKKRGGGNIQDDPAYDPFPKSGLVKQYEQFIRDEADDSASAIHSYTHPMCSSGQSSFRSPLSGRLSQD